MAQPFVEVGKYAPVGLTGNVQAQFRCGCQAVGIAAGFPVVDGVELKGGQSLLAGTAQGQHAAEGKEQRIDEAQADLLDQGVAAGFLLGFGCLDLTLFGKERRIYIVYAAFKNRRQKPFQSGNV